MALMVEILDTADSGSSFNLNKAGFMFTQSVPKNKIYAYCTKRYAFFHQKATNQRQKLLNLQIVYKNNLKKQKIIVDFFVRM